jgi:site-specific recombinase XerD
LVLQSFVEMKVDGWKSEYRSVDIVLRHLQRKSSGYGTPSYASLEWYVSTLNLFCTYAGKDPDQLVSLPKPEIEELIHSYLDSLVVKGLSKKTVRTRRTCLIMHFKKNGFKGDRELDIEVYAVPARYRKQAEHIPSSDEILKMADGAKSVRDRAIILCMYTSGLRESTVKALRYRDVKHDLDKSTILIPVYPEMKKIHPKACKNNIPYYTFFDSISSEALKSYLRNREARFGRMDENEILFAPSAGASHVPHDVAKFKPLAKMEINRIVKNAARNAGLKEWNQVHPHCLRKSFEEAMRRRRPDGTMMNEKEAEFLHGHLLPGSQDPYFGSGIRVQGSAVSFDMTVATKLREEYSMVQFFPSRQLVTQSNLDAEVKKELLMMFSNLNEEEIAKLGDLSTYTREQIRELARSKQFETLGLKGKSTQKIIPFGELRDAITDGWELVQRLDDTNEAIVRLPK